MQLAHPMAGASTAEWRDRGRTALYVSIALNAVAAIVVIAVFRAWLVSAFVVCSFLPLAATSHRSTIVLRVIAMCLLYALCFVTMFSVGMYFIPGVVAMFVATMRSE